MKNHASLSPIFRGLSRRCPACGEGKLFAGYLKLVSECDRCGEAFNHDQAADGPAWLTVLMLGPFFAPIIFLSSMTAGEHVLIVLPLLAIFMVTTALGVLAFMKGAWLGALWRMEQNRQD
tara:strand:+ start:52696 stop:53055 length:360 start_codon:yes stop_codon:yes gene_type:complete